MFVKFVTLTVLVLLSAPAGRSPVALAAGNQDTPLMAAPPATSFVSDEIAAVHGRLRLTPAESRDLIEIYAQRAQGPIWVTADGRTGSEVASAIALLNDAANDGLVAADYDAAALASAAAAPVPLPAQEAARLDVHLTASMLRYFRHLHHGRVDPRSIGVQIAPQAESHHFADILLDAVAHGRVREAVDGLRPGLTQYQLLRWELPRYRAMPATTPRTPLPDVLRPGDTFDDMAWLEGLLVRLGDLPAPSPVTPMTYDDTIRAGIEHFQRRHGLEPDGIIGRGTRDALLVPPSSRARQIELAMERLRWLPDLAGGRVIAVNIPMFRLWAWNAVPSNTPPALTMRVIVGRALDTRTPVFADQMEHIIFRPYWNVPSSILRGEMIPAIARSASYLSRQNLELVAGPGDDAPVLAATPENIARLGRDGLRLRQRPGPTNALGLLKFMFPNDDNVYMHGTPAPQLFERSRRDFSHGCIRVEDPVALAEWVLSDLPDWPRARIEVATNGPSNLRVNLPEPIQVVIFYTTAVVDPYDSSVHFVEDVYRQDPRLAAALTRF